MDEIAPLLLVLRAGLSDSGGGSGDGGEKREKDGKAEKKGLRLWRGSMQSPKQKGDWKDVLLMSLSFAVYVYISQKLVCAYCA
ncbi:unnamed protein product [Spirodela intermedia]|uniref:Uncharacterized protein n=1 Tax=Spirodela intermedia TaxID=51605 RepID=A0A7I8IMS4_SPIIN|nr:unnamed protein product [Spirodela intermedia]CAA6659146.1 unnamed protein product [Spirodela intermedia]